MEKDSKIATEGAGTAATTGDASALNNADRIAGAGAAPAETFSKMRAYMKSKLPDRNFGSDEEYEDALMEHIENSDKTVDDYRTADETIRQVVNDYPEMAEIIEDLSAGTPLEVALAKHFDRTDLFPEEGELNYEEAKAAHEARKAKRAESKEFVALRDKNMADSHKEIEAFIEEEGLDEEQVNEFIGKFDKFMADFSDGKISRAGLKFFRQALNYDDDMAAAKEAGAVASKNEKIEAKRAKAASETDSLPTGGGDVFSPALTDKYGEAMLP